MIFFILMAILVLCLPIAWLISEYQDRRWLRITLGAGSILASFAVAALVGMLEQFTYNAWYGTASKQLIETTIAEIKNDNCQQLLTELERLDANVQPTYEHRGRFDELVNDFAGRFDKREPPPNTDSAAIARPAAPSHNSSGSDKAIP